MIKGVFIINNHGQVRLAKWYEAVADSQQQTVLREIFLTVSKRSESVCNFTGGDGLSAGWSNGVKLIYRHYATLYFVFACEDSESELGILDLIQVLVEVLDQVFESVCELDIIFHFDKVCYILDEVVMGGLVLETSMVEILHAINETTRLERTPESAKKAPSRGIMASSGPFSFAKR